MNDNDKKLLADFISGLVADSANLTGKVLEIIGRIIEAAGSAAATTDPLQFGFLLVISIITLSFFANTTPYSTAIRKAKLDTLFNLLGIAAANHHGILGGESVINLPNGLTITISALSPFGIAVGPTAPKQPDNSVQTTQPPITSASGGTIQPVNGDPPFLTGNAIIDLQGTPFETQWDATVAALGYATIVSAGSLFGKSTSPIVEQGADGKFYVTDAKIPNLKTPGVAVALAGPLNDYAGVRGFYTQNSNNPAVPASNIKFVDGHYWIIGYVGVVT